MKALQIVTPGRCALVDRPVPAPGPGEVLLRVRVVGYCGTDLNTFRGLNPLVQYPRVPGHEIGAVIAARGAEVPSEWAEGLEVTLSPYINCGQCGACRQGRPNCCRSNQTLGVQCDGAMTEYIVAPWKKLYRSPKLGLRELALVEPLTIGFHAVDRGRVTNHDTVLVFGCGAIGLGVIAGAARRGARVVAVDVDDAKLALARRCGARETVNSRSVNLHERVRELTNGEGATVAIEAVGVPETFRAAVDEAAHAGRVVYIGYAKQPVQYETKQFILKELDILGSRNATGRDFETVIGFLESGRFPVAEVITRNVPFPEAPAALQDWSTRPADVTKIQVRVD